MEPPSQFYERPEIEPQFEDYWRAFHELGSERQLGMGVGPIPRSKIKEYVADEFGLAGDAHDFFCAILIQVDDDYVVMANDTSKNAGKSDVAINDTQGVLAAFARIESSQKNKDRKASSRAKNQ